MRRDGVSGLTTRSVTLEAGVAKGVLHRHFGDFDSFLVDLVQDRMAMITARAAELMTRVGESSVTNNVRGAMIDVLDLDTAAMITLVSARDSLKQRLQGPISSRVPVIDQIVHLLRAYLGAEQKLGRIRSGTDIATAARTLVGAAHLVLLGDPASPPSRGITRAVNAIIGPILAETTGPKGH